MTDRELMQEALYALTYVGDAKEIYSDTIESLRARLAQPEQEPVLWAAKESMFMWGKSDEHGHPYHIICKGQKVRSHQIPLYTAPPQREWQGLTDEDVEYAVGAIFKGFDMKPRNQTEVDYLERVVRLIEAKLKEKNNG